jgi:hypothetical protein
VSAKYFYTSLTRISGLRERAFELQRLSRGAWRAGDYVVGEVVEPALVPIELDTGRMVEVVPGDHIIGAFGERRATLEVVGNWRAIGDDGRMELLTGAGIVGRATSRSNFLAPLTQLAYRGHVHLDGKPARMKQFVAGAEERAFLHPVVLVVGTSMSAGKTTAARVITRLLFEDNRKVIGAKLTGAGRFRDILSMRDAGAYRIIDFVDAGLPSTVCPEDEYAEALDFMVHRMAAIDADVVVAEAGASPLEPYNGRAAYEGLLEHIRCMVLCAADPYSVVGVMQAFDREPDVVCGLATSTEAGIELVTKLSGLPALNILDSADRQEMKQILDTLLDEL